MWTSNLLTGTTDENGVRFSLFTYNYDSRVFAPSLPGQSIDTHSTPFQVRSSSCHRPAKHYEDVFNL